MTFSGFIADGAQMPSNDSRFDIIITINAFFGDTQSASSFIINTTKLGKYAQLSGVAYIAFRLEWDADKYKIIPNIQAKIQGKLISTYDSNNTRTANRITILLLFF